MWKCGRLVEGTKSWKEGSWEIGSWKDDRLHGVGSIHYKDGTTSNGYLKNGRYHGSGTLRQKCQQRDASGNLEVFAQVKKGVWRNGKLYKTCTLPLFRKSSVVR